MGFCRVGGTVIRQGGSIMIQSCKSICVEQYHSAVTTKYTVPFTIPLVPNPYSILHFLCNFHITQPVLPI